jgi:hypothetical protein
MNILIFPITIIMTGPLPFDLSQMDAPDRKIWLPDVHKALTIHYLHGNIPLNIGEVAGFSLFPTRSVIQAHRKQVLSE